MSAEDDFRALLVAHAGVSALVDDRVSENAAPQGADLPYIAFSVRHDHTHNLLGTLVEDRCTITVQCWAESAEAAGSVAAAVADAVGDADLARGAAVLSAEGGYDPELKLDASILTVEWWAAV